MISCHIPLETTKVYSHLVVSRGEGPGALLHVVWEQDGGGCRLDLPLTPEKAGELAQAILDQVHGVYVDNLNAPQAKYDAMEKAVLRLSSALCEIWDEYGDMPVSVGEPLSDLKSMVLHYGEGSK